MNYFKRFLIVVFTPLLLVWKTLENICVFLLHFVDIVFKTANTMERSLTDTITDKVNDSKKERKLRSDNEAAKNIVKITVEGRNNILSDFSTDKVILFSTGFLQIISAYTTYSGFKFYFDSLNKAIPVFLTFLVQGMLFYLINTFGCERKGAFKRFFLLLLFLFVSIFFSYFGIATKNINMEDYLKKQYTSFEETYTQTWDYAHNYTYFSSDPTAFLLAELFEAENSLINISETVKSWELEESSIRTTINIKISNDDGSVTTKSGIDKDAQIYKAELQNKISTVNRYLSELNSSKNNISNNNSFSDTIANLLSLKLSGNELSEKDKQKNQEFSAWIKKYNEFMSSDYINSSSYLHNLDELSNNNNTFTKLQNDLQIQSYNYHKIQFPEKELSEFETVLKDYVDNLYYEFIKYTSHIEDENFVQLKKALSDKKEILNWEDLNIIAIKYLLEKNSINHNKAILCLVLAIANDMGAFFIVLTLGRKKERFDNAKNAADLKTHESSLIANAILCILTQRNVSDIHKDVLDILCEFYCCFETAPFMVSTGFSTVCSENSMYTLNTNLLPLTSTLLKLDYIRTITKEQYSLLMTQERDKALILDLQDDCDSVNGDKQPLYIMRNKFELELQRMISTSFCDNEIMKEILNAL